MTYMPLKIVHCADLHIGASFSSLSTAKASVRSEELRTALSDIIKFCKEKSADALLICGDLFDNPNPMEKDREFVRKELSSLSPTPVFIICGNHDYMCPESPYANEKYFSDNVHIFPCFDYAYQLEDKNCVIYGKSYSSSVTEPSFANTETDKSKINICCLHGDFLRSGDYNTITADSLSNCNFNYAAFGHIHNGEVFEVGGVKCAYSGAAEGHSFNDDGFTGFIYAEITEEETKLLPITLSKRHYKNISYDISGDDFSQTVVSLKEIINRNDLYKITLVGEYISSPDISRIKEELEAYAFYLDIEDESTPSYNFDEIEKEESLRGEFLRELRKITHSEEEFIKCGKVGLDALSGRIPNPEVEL